jgi:hypothetical protein
MFDSRPKELIHAEELRSIGKVDKSLEKIQNYFFPFIYHN